MIRSRGPRTAVGLLAAACLLPGVSFSETMPHEPPSNFFGIRIAPMGSSQSNYVLCSDGQGGAIVAFSTYIGSSSDIFVQRINPLGEPQWSASGIPVCATPEDQWPASIVPDGAGGAILVWGDLRGGGGVHTDIWAQRIDASGAALWAAQGIPVVVAANSQTGIRAISDGEGGVILAWYDNGPSNAVLGVHAQRIDAAGARLWGQDGVPLCVLPGGQYDPALATDGAGGAIIFWDDSRAGDAIYGQHVGADGIPTWGDDGKRLSFGSGNTRFPTALEDGSGGAFFAWDEYVAADGYDAYLQRVDAAGSLVWPGTGFPLSTLPGNNFEPRLAPDGAGGVFAVWPDLRSGVNTDLYLQRFAADGTPQLGENGMEVVAGPGYQRAPSVVADGGGGVLVAWYDDRAGSDKWDVYTQGVGGAGILRWDPNGVPICTARYGQTFPILIPSYDGAAVVAWGDSRAGSFSNIYASKTPQGPVHVHHDEVDAVTLAPLGPNPSRDGVHVAFTLPTAGHARLALYDVAGRRVRSIYDGTKEAGVHQQYVDLASGPGQRLGSGVYLMRLEAAGQVRTGRFVFLP